MIVGTIADWETPLRSRAIRAYVALPSLDRSPAEFLSALLRLADEFCIDTVMPINDRALLLLAPHYEVVRARLRLACPRPEQIASILNKGATMTIAAGLGIPVPVSIKCESWSELEAQKSRLNFPLFAKSRDKSDALCSSQIADPRLRRFDDFSEMREALAGRGGLVSGLLLQEYCPGDDVGLAVLMRAGEALTVFQYRALRLFPAEGGVCVLACTEKVDAKLADCAVQLLRKLSWEGVAQLDFRHDAKTGRFALLEINGRFWGSLAAAIAAGIDFPFGAWQLARGEVPVFPPEYKTGLLVRWLEGDFRRLLGLSRFRRETGRDQISLSRDWLHFLAGFRPNVREMFWSWTDPVPYFDTIANLTRWWLVSRCIRLGKKMGLRQRGRVVRDRMNT